VVGGRIYIIYAIYIICGQVNNKVTNHLRFALDEAVERGFLDVNNPVHLFTISTIGQELCTVALRRWIQAWNFHTIPKKGMLICSLVLTL
jgi:hypothetical protein